MSQRLLSATARGVGVALRRRLGRGAALGRRIAEEQMIGDLLVAAAALPGQVVGPAEQLEHGPDQLLLGGGLVHRMKAVGLFEKGVGPGAEGVEVSGLGEGFLPGGGVEDALFEKVAGKELAGHSRWFVAGGCLRMGSWDWAGGIVAQGG